MGSSPLMSLGVRAMAANYAALQTTGHNIANANMPGYSRQQTVLATSQGQFTGAGFFGRGVDVVSVTRSHNEFLTRETANAASLSAMDAARLGQLKRLETVFQTGESGLGYAVTEVFNAMVDLSSRPTDLATRQVVLARATDMAARFSEAGTTLDQTQAEVTADLKTSVSEVNQLTTAIANANQRVASLRGLGQPANDVLDERDRLIGQLSEKIRVTRIEADDGTVGLFIGGGQRLVLAGQATQLAVVPNDVDPSRSALALREGTGTLRRIDDSGLGGGSMAGLIRFQNVDLSTARNLVGQLAAAVGGALNDQQVRGLSLQQPMGQNPAQPLFAMGPQRALAQEGNLRDVNTGLPIGNVALSIVDARALEASDYDLRESGDFPGSWTLTRVSDGLVRTVNSGDVVDGMRIDITDAQPGDRYLLQPVSRMANGMRNLLTSPLDLAAASPLLATGLSTNTGTGAPGDLVVTASPQPFPGTPETLQFFRLAVPVDGNDFEYVSSITGVATPWRTGQPVVGANGYTLQINGVPADTDSFLVEPTPAASLASNNGNARAMLALRDALIVGGRTVSDSWSQSLADIGVRVQSAVSSASISAAVASQSEQARSSQDGVNLDEEAARLIQFQQSYQAAAKVLQVAQSLFDTLLNAAGQ
jgi:flagellar hook-associated protein 1 FlgK